MESNNETKRARRIARNMTIGAVIGLAAAPLVAGAVGATAGLAGGAAFAHGLAVVGGGSLASGGTGMVGGYAVLGAIGATSFTGIGEALEVVQSRREAR